MQNLSCEIMIKLQCFTKIWCKMAIIPFKILHQAPREGLIIYTVKTLKFTYKGTLSTIEKYNSQHIQFSGHSFEGLEYQVGLMNQSVGTYEHIYCPVEREEYCFRHFQKHGIAGTQHYWHRGFENWKHRDVPPCADLPEAPCWQLASLICIANPRKAVLIWQELKRIWLSIVTNISNPFVLGFRERREKRGADDWGLEPDDL